MTILEQLEITNFSAKVMPLNIIGGIAEEPIVADVPVITGARKAVYKNYGMIFGAIGPGVTTTLVPGVRPGMEYGDFSRNIINNSGNIPLFIQGNIKVETTRTLFINGGYLSVASYIPLVCFNEAASSGRPLYIGGLGTTPGAVPISSAMNLFIKTMFTEAIPLYMLCGPQPSSINNMPLYINGGSLMSGTIPMVIPGVSERINNNIPLYTSGF